jgi:hypothetical protein
MLQDLVAPLVQAGDLDAEPWEILATGWRCGGLHRLLTVESRPSRGPGVRRRISLRANGRELAVEVSCGGVGRLDWIQVP